MGLIERIKSALGLGASSSTSQPAASSTDGPSPGDDPGTSGDGVDVTVEHEPATASEDAVKGTDTATDSGSTTATEPTGSEVDTDSEAETVTEADASGSADAAEDTDDEAADESSPAGAPTDPAPDAELEDIKGIGPTYGERLREAGIDGVGALAESDPAALSEETDIAESRVENWVEQAKLY